MSYWQELPGKLETSILKLAGGIHTGFPPIDISEEQASDVSNLDTHHYPALSTRPGRAVKGTSLAILPTGLFQWDSTKYAGYGTNLVKWVVADWDTATKVKTDCSGHNIEAAQFMGLGIFTDQHVWYKVTLATGVLTALGGTPPVGKYITVHANRVYLAGLDLHPSGLAHSALRKAEDYTTAEDAGLKYMDTADAEIVTGLTAAFDHVIAFKEHWMFELYGTGPINYQFVQGPPGMGCVAHRSIVLLNGVLYWLGDEKVYAYKGGSAPEEISFPVQASMKALNHAAWGTACAGTDGTRYILSIPTGISTVPNVTLSYDPRVNAWHIWEIDNPVAYLKDGTDLLIADDSGQVARSAGSITTDFGTAISWYRISKAFMAEPQVRNQSLEKLSVVADLDVGSTLAAYVAGTPEGTTWTSVGSATPTGLLARTRILVPPSAVADKDFVRIKLSGTGVAQLHRLERSIRIKAV